jgi:hypothetical protein
MKRIEILTDVKDDGGYYKGEIRHVTPEKAGYLCGVGWARDLSGELPTGTPDLTDKTLSVQNATHLNKPTKAG